MNQKEFIKSRFNCYSSDTDQKNEFESIVNELVSQYQYTRNEAIDLMHHNIGLLDRLCTDKVDAKTIVANLLKAENEAHSKSPISGYSNKSSKDLEQFKIQVSNYLYDHNERYNDLPDYDVDGLMKEYDKYIDKWANEGFDPLEVSLKIQNIESYDNDD